MTATCNFGDEEPGYRHDTRVVPDVNQEGVEFFVTQAGRPVMHIGFVALEPLVHHN